MKGNAPVYQVNTVVSRITGEGRAEFLRTWGPDFDQKGGGRGGRGKIYTRCERRRYVDYVPGTWYLVPGTPVQSTAVSYEVPKNNDQKSQRSKEPKMHTRGCSRVSNCRVFVGHGSAG